MPHLVIEFNDEAVKNIKLLQERMRCPDVPTTICRALSLLDTATQHVHEGGYIFFKKPDGTVERIIL